MQRPCSHARKMLCNLLPAFVLCLLANRTSNTRKIAPFWPHCVRIYSNPSHSPAPMRIILQNNPLVSCNFVMCCSTWLKWGSLIPCAWIPNVTWVQLCLRFQRIAKHRVDQHPAVTAVPETPRAPIKLPCAKTARDGKGLNCRCRRMVALAKHSSLQLFACGPVLYPLDWAARSQLGMRSFLRYTAASLATARIHTVHGGAEPRACLTGLRV